LGMKTQVGIGKVGAGWGQKEIEAETWKKPGQNTRLYLAR